MEKLNKVLTILKKYHFWVGCVVVLLITIVCWWLATAGLASQFQQRKKKLEGDFAGVRKIQRNDPNDKVVEAIQAENTVLKDKVLKAWESLYRQQKEKNPFPKVLGAEFKRQFENLNLKSKEELEIAYRERYQYFIIDHLPTLLKMVDVRRPADEKETGAGNRRDAADRDGRNETGVARTRATRTAARGGIGMTGIPGIGGRTTGTGANGATEEEWTGVVDWNPADLQSLETRFTWKDSTPSTLAVVLAQEDLWVIEALLRVIAETNGKEATYATAAVKRIDSLQIGREAVSRGGDETIFKAGGAGAGGGMAGMGGGAPGMGGGVPGMGGGMPGRVGGGLGGGLGGGGRMGGMPGGMGGGTTGGAADDSKLVEGRYVGEKGEPLAAEPEYPFAKHPFAEFKMMPIRMNLVMDQRRLPKLLVACANSNMPIEVQRIRIKSQGSGGAAVAPAATGGAFGGGRVGRTGGGNTAAADSQEANQTDVPVEIYGVIYIYNPPNRELLGTGAASADKSETEKTGDEKPAVPATSTNADAVEPAKAPAGPGTPDAPAAPGGPAGSPETPKGPPNP